MKRIFVIVGGNYDAEVWEADLPAAEDKRGFRGIPDAMAIFKYFSKNTHFKHTLV